MILGIDATNIRHGGGVTHLIEIMRAADPFTAGFTRIVIWSGRSTLNQIEDRQWLIKMDEPFLNMSLIHRTYWQRHKLTPLAIKAGCDVLFVPGGNFAGSFRPIVTMSRNLLPFEWRELRRFGWSWMALKLTILRLSQTRSYRRADGLIFLNHYASETVMKVVKYTIAETIIIPHGINFRFSLAPRKQLSIDHYHINHPFRILYVSTIDMFKHQWVVAEAVSNLRRRGLPITLDLVGAAYPPALKKLQYMLELVDPESIFIKYRGAIPYSKLHKLYAEANLGLFASSCENMPNILVELMASGLPIVCSNSGPMPEVLGEAGEYFDPEIIEDVERALLKMINSTELRAKKAATSFERSAIYSWTECASKTLDFLSKVAQR